MIKMNLDIVDILINGKNSEELINAIADRVASKMMSKPMMSKKKVKRVDISVGDASELVNVSRSKIRNLIHKGELIAEKVDPELTKSKFLINYQSLVEYFKLEE